MARVRADSIFGPVAADLDRLETRLLQAVDEDGGAMSTTMAELVAAGGKRIRPGLVLLWAWLGAYDFGRVAPAAIAIEVTHVATLVHDDVIDRAELRRGRPTAAKRLGPDAAIVLGDHYFAKAYDLAAATGDAAVVAELARAVMAVCRAELEQQADRLRWSISEEDYVVRIRGKTASLLAASCWIGAHLGQAGALGDVARCYGEELGLAFQISDDVLDYTAVEAEVGKPVGHDLAEGHATLPLIKALPKLNAAPRDGRALRPMEVTALVHGVRDSGAVEAAAAVAHEHAERARAALEPLPDGPARDALAALAGYVVSRRR
jgi:geranylgeranyl pyrophosphate synthase